MYRPENPAPMMTASRGVVDVGDVAFASVMTISPIEADPVLCTSPYVSPGTVNGKG